MRKPLAAVAVMLALALPFALVPPAPAQKAPGAAPAAPDSDAVAAARELMQVSGAARQFEAVVPMMMGQMQDIFIKMKPGNEKDIRDIFGEAGKRILTRKQELIEEIAKLYATKLTAAELRELSAFYRSGIGAKFVAMQPELMQQSMVIGQRWGQRIGQEVDADVRRELKKRGIDL